MQEAMTGEGFDFEKVKDVAFRAHVWLEPLNVGQAFLAKVHDNDYSTGRISSASREFNRSKQIARFKPFLSIRQLSSIEFTTNLPFENLANLVVCDVPVALNNDAFKDKILRLRTRVLEGKIFSRSTCRDEAYKQDCR